MNLGGIFDLTNKEEELETLQDETAKPDFWNDPQNAQKITQRVANLREDVEKYRKLHAQLEDLQLLLGLAIEEDDQTVSEEIQTDLKGITAEVEDIEFKLMLSGEHDPNNAILSIHPGAGGTESQDWAAMLIADASPLVRSA